MKNTLLAPLLVFVLVSMAFCAAPFSDNPVPNSTSEKNTTAFDAYWYAGAAEISTYNLKQARYGEVHDGKSVMVFVTEDFLLDKQVKKESASDLASTSVLKLNKIDRFTTGIYDYSLMLSTFTPIDRVSYPFTLKTSFSAQDWCGHAFMQVNRRGNGYQALIRSYFESEGDKNKILESAVLEDELWTLARLDPKQLPIGAIDIIPSSHQLRLRHTPMTVDQATGQLTIEIADDQSEQFIYTLKYSSGRELKMKIQSVFPYRLYGWEEKVKSGFGTDAKWLTTVATLDKTIKSSYWAEHDLDDKEKRSSLGLD